MAIDIQALGFHHLSVRERLNLIEQIWETLPEQVDPSDVCEWHQDELTRRRAKADAVMFSGKPWQEVLDRLEHGS